MSCRYRPERDAFKHARNYAFARLAEAGRAPLAAVARWICPRAASPPAEWRKGLILGPSHVGDLLCRTCALPQLVQGLPRCEWWHMAEPSTAEVLSGNPAVHHVLALRRSDAAFHLSDADLRSLRNLSFDVALCPSAVRCWPDLLLALRLRIPNRVALAHKGLTAFMTHPVRSSFPSPAPAYFRAMVSAVAGAPADGPLRPQLFPTEQDEADALAAWKSLGPTDDRPLIAIFLTSRQSARRWPTEHFVSLIDQLSLDRHARCVLCGARQDAQVLTAVAAQCRGRPNVFAGVLGIKALACFLRRCSAVLCPDSGPRHMANAVGTPVVFFRNLAVHQVETGAYCETERDVAPDGQFLAPDEQERVLRAVRPETVAAALMSQAERQP